MAKWFKAMLFEAVCDGCRGGGMVGEQQDGQGGGGCQVDDVWRDGRPIDEAL